ncbi:MAG: hypothetical protein V1831_02135 [Candidatus Woesearchaeota archaeon]
MEVLIKFILLFVLLVSSSNVVFAATIYGNIYDLSLSKVSGARVEVNTTPEQHLISKDGRYSFEIPNGFYTIKAELRGDGISGSESRNITITQEGNYVIDLVLFPNFEEEDEITREIEIGLPAEKKSFVSLFVLIFVFILGVIFYWVFKSRDSKGKAKEAEDDTEKDLDDIVKIIKKEGGRATQKQIRKEIPLSEAKISLMIAELEHKGVVEKIKKGRGNIIILKRN